MLFQMFSVRKINSSILLYATKYWQIYLSVLQNCTVRGGFYSSLYLDIVSLETNAVFSKVLTTSRRIQNTIILFQNPLSVYVTDSVAYTLHICICTSCLQSGLLIRAAQPDRTSVTHCATARTYPEHSLSPVNQHKPTALVVFTSQKKFYR